MQADEIAQETAALPRSWIASSGMSVKIISFAVLALVLLAACATRDTAKALQQAPRASGALPACDGMYEVWPPNGAVMALPDGGSQACDPDAPTTTHIDLKAAGDPPAQ